MTVGFLTSMLVDNLDVFIKDIRNKHIYKRGKAGKMHDYKDRVLDFQFCNGWIEIYI